MQTPKKVSPEGRSPVIMMNIMFFILAILGAALLFSTYQSQWEAKQSLSWPSIQGVISKNRIREYTNDDTNSISYEPIVTYSFIVGDKTYTSNHISSNAPWGYAFGTMADAEQFIRQYPIGKQLKVYYNPDNPRRALLDRTQPADPGLTTYILGWWLLALIPVALLIDLLWAIGTYRAEGCPDAWKHLDFWWQQFQHPKRNWGVKA
jgi:hypothetical protein